MARLFIVCRALFMDWAKLGGSDSKQLLTGSGGYSRCRHLGFAASDSQFGGDNRMTRSPETVTDAVVSTPHVDRHTRDRGRQHARSEGSDRAARRRDDPYLLEWTSEGHYRLHVFPATQSVHISIEVELEPAPEQVRVDRRTSLFADVDDAYVRHEIKWPTMRPHKLLTCRRGTSSTSSACARSDRR